MLNQSYSELFPNQKPVPVICSFDSEGHMCPMYVRINGEAYKICSSCEKSSYANAAVFQCQINDHDQLKPLILEYRYREHLWLMPK